MKNPTDLLGLPFYTLVPTDTHSDLPSMVSDRLIYCNGGLLIRSQVYQSAWKSPTDLLDLPLHTSDPPGTLSDLLPMVSGPIDVIKVYQLGLRSHH